jgi:hypothetical protein
VSWQRFDDPAAHAPKCRDDVSTGWRHRAMEASDTIDITSDAGGILAVVPPDPAVRRGVVYDGSGIGVSISTDRDTDPIMPCMSATPHASPACLSTGRH